MGYALEQLGADRCREIAESLFRVEKIYGGVKLHGFCPIHGDEKTSSFVYHFVEDWYKCQSCGAGGDLVKLWQELTGKEFTDFKAEFVGDADTRTRQQSPGTGRNSQPSAPKEDSPDVFVPDEALAALPPLPDEKIRDLRTKRGWSPEMIAALDLREYTDMKGNKRIAIPVRDDQGRLCNVRLYMPGAEEFKIISWFDQVCLKCGGKWKRVDKKKVCKDCGSPPNDYGRTRLLPPPSKWKPGQLWLCEGEPDTVCALSQGMNAVTQTAGCGTWRKEFSKAMKGRDVIICYDADQAGYDGAMEAAVSIAEYAKTVRVIKWPEVMGV